jgi:glycosyltransferase involved in cell wall biosynthesis
MVILFNDRGRKVDGIRDHTRMLEASLSRASGLRVSTQYQLAPPWRRRRARLPNDDVVILQYSPFSYARWGLAPWLPALLLALRIRARRPFIVLNVHEPYVPMSSPRSVAMGLWQRVQLAALQLGSDLVFSSIESWTRALSGRWPRRRVHHLPVGSNLPDMRDARAEERERMKLGDDGLILACFGRDHPSWLSEHVIVSANAVSRTGRRTVLLSLGAEAPRLDGLDPAVVLDAPGYLATEAIARRLAAADIFLSPLIDGVSTRRGTLMAALQHGLPIVGTAGPLTDSILLESSSALSLVAVGDLDGFADEVRRLADEAAERQSMRGAGRRLYERNFDWPVAAERILEEIDMERER